KEYGIHSGGPNDEFDVWPSAHASWNRVHDFQAKKAQNHKLMRSTSNRRARLSRGESNGASTSIATCPRRDCTKAADRNVAPTSRNAAASPCQSVAIFRK